ncbi:hypothetical protein COF68_04780 [Bacillus toyonensis]|uniref:hypothetical protein n=1 Tax=Bacillus toyonensis TaxID=155322 RepID=UPI000BFDFE87|nr:hypothetical protein [Bacillus toyonensis]PHE64166.1 hypothetical protein COF68_04780 [Bacillus toyonensis]
MDFMSRPIKNLKQLDWGAVIWMVAWTSLIAVWVLPAQARMGVSESISFLFSLDFYSEPSVTGNMLSQVQNNASNLLNIGKVVIWLMTAIMLAVFLFKKPKNV